MIFVDQLVAFSGRELRKGLFSSGIPRPVHDLLKRMDVHVSSLWVKGERDLAETT
jgi:hypothetical protein